VTVSVEVRTLFASLSASREVSGQLTLPDVMLGEQVYHFEGPVDFSMTLTNVGTGIIAAGTATATVHTPCSRCLCDTVLRLEAEVEGLYVQPGHDEGIPEEQEYELIGDDMSVDLEPAIAQSLLVELPFATLHDPDCKGICPVCGADRNLVDCECEPPAAASPFDALKAFPLKDHEDA
jgi:uncharacterized protein